jgi:hypothetical protein
MSRLRKHRANAGVAGTSSSSPRLRSPSFVCTNPKRTIKNIPSSTGSARINGLDLYYEIRGEGASLVLLHGGVNSSEMFGAPLLEMAKTRKVIAVLALQYQPVT